MNREQQKERRRNRRNSLAKKKDKAKKIYPWMEEDAIKLADHLCDCSCDMCKNPRKSKFHKKDKLTMQERKFFLDKDNNIEE